MFIVLLIFCFQFAESRLLGASTERTFNLIHVLLGDDSVKLSTFLLKTTHEARGTSIYTDCTCLNTRIHTQTNPFHHHSHLARQETPQVFGERRITTVGVGESERRLSEGAQSGPADRWLWGAGVPGGVRCGQQACRQKSASWPDPESAEPMTEGRSTSDHCDVRASHIAHSTATTGDFVIQAYLMWW